MSDSNERCSTTPMRAGRHRGRSGGRTFGRGRVRWAEVEGRIRGADVHATMAAGMPLSLLPARVAHLGGRHPVPCSRAR